MSHQVAFAKRPGFLHIERSRLGAGFRIPGILRHAGSQLFKRRKHSRKRPVRIVALITKVGRFIPRLCRHERWVDIQDIESRGKHFAGKFTARRIHAKIRSSSFYKAFPINFFLHGNRDHQ